MDKWEIEKKIVIQCMKNPEFKRKLLSKPKDALRELFAKEKGFNKSFLDNVNVVVHQEKKNEFHISLPHHEELESITDEELKRVAGGRFPDCWGTA